MQYYDENERTSKRVGIAAAAVYIAVWVVVMIVVTFDFEQQQSGEGMLIDFGDTELAGGLGTAQQPASTPQQQEPHPPQQQNPAVTQPESVLTQDIEDAPEVAVPQTRPQERPAETQPTERPAEQPAPQPERQVDQRALFPGAAASANDTSRGNAEGEGRQGSADGTPGASPDGSGTGGQGGGFDLSGRSLVGALPAPRYGPNKEGRVIVDITVDARGRVIRAVPRAQGSTTNDSELIRAALQAAEKAQFNSVEGDGLQTGTITYNFILK